ncbi:MAG: class I tRNA ligase family protein [Patescibacteria group bacterium]
MKYDHRRIEKKWQREWDAQGLYRTREDASKKKCFVLDMFPYPSGDGLHVGHPKGYIATDIYSRMKRMQGYTVLHPMGWDAFGLPAENFAIKNKVHPRKAVEQNIARFKEQLSKIGFNYDWGREVNTTDPEYYRWTQWIFIKLFEKGLAYQSYEPINWCPSCQTGLANEDLDGGVCERCGSIVEKRPMRQWVLRITEYADRLLADLQDLPQWPEHIKESQRNWIGRSEGALIKFPLFGISGQTDGKHAVEVFTTRPDTMFGATFIAISPELAQKWISIGWKAPSGVATLATQMIEERKKAGVKGITEKKGSDTGLFAENPINHEKIPVWLANYVLGDIGTGAIMAVPAHDERDFEFAKKYNLPMRRVVEPKFTATSGDSMVKEGEDFVKRDAICAVVRNPKDDTYLCVSWKQASMKGLVTGGVEPEEDIVQAARREILEETGYKNLRLVRNTGFALHSLFYHRLKKQNRWARFQYLFFELEDESRNSIDEHEEALHDIVWQPASKLKDFFSVIEGTFSVHLIENPDYIFTGDGVLHASNEFDDMDSVVARRKMTDAVGGTWTTTYRLKDWVFSRQRYWGEPIPIIHCEQCGPVAVPEKDLPVLLPDVEKYEPTGTGESPLAGITDWVNTTCPVCSGPGKRETNTMPQWAGSCWYYLRYMDPQNSESLVASEREKYWAPVDVYVGGAEHATRHLIYARFWHKFLLDHGFVSTAEPFSRLISVGLIMAEDGRKMSKRYGNVINPDDVVETWGADTLRLYEMFMGPFTDAIAWSTDNMIGVRRFLERVWRLQDSVSDATTPNATAELHRTIKKVGEDIEHFKFNTAISQMMIFLNCVEKESLSREDYLTFIRLLAPFAPHVSEEIWSMHGGQGSIHINPWPIADEGKIVMGDVVVVVQINGKIRAQIPVDLGMTDTEIIKKARLAVEKWLEGKEVMREVIVPKKLINFVIR